MPISTIDLDHIALAAERRDALWPRYAAELGGRWVGGGETAGFATAQVRFANGMKIEAIEPYAPEDNDFLRRFLDRSGPGPHHVTFKVADIHEALGAVDAAGYSPVGVDLTDPLWREAFLHPKDAFGLVVQIAQPGGDWSSEPPPGFPQPAHGATAALARIVHAVADVEAALGLFRDLLGGTETGRGEDRDGKWAELAWPGPGRVRLLHPGPDTEAAAWMGDRPGRVLELTFTCPWLAASVVVPAEDNLGTRLRLLPEGVS